MNTLSKEDFIKKLNNVEKILYKLEFEFYVETGSTEQDAHIEAVRKIGIMKKIKDNEKFFH